MSKFIDTQKVLISLLSGYNTYFESEHPASTLTGDSALAIQHSRTGEMYYALPISTPVNLLENEWFIKKWRRIIEYPCSAAFLWPVDFIRRNVETPESYLVYEFRATANYQSLAELSRKSGFLGIDNPVCRAVALQFAAAFESLEDKGYLYFGLDDDSLFINPDAPSVLIPFNEGVSVSKNAEIAFTENDYFSEVVDPYQYHKRQTNAQGTIVYTYDALSEQYAFESLLFRLLIGLYPYEGPSMDEYAYNSDSADNKDWIFKYLQNSVFIFDRNDNGNSIEMYKKNEVHRNRWQKLTPRLREMFESTLVHDAVFRNRVVTYTASQWREALTEAFAQFQ